MKLWLALTSMPSCAGVEAVDLLLSKDFPGQNRGFAFVEFYNHACANAARNTLTAPTFRWGPAAAHHLGVMAPQCWENHCNVASPPHLGAVCVFLDF